MGKRASSPSAASHTAEPHASSLAQGVEGVVKLAVLFRSEGTLQGKVLGATGGNGTPRKAKTMATLLHYTDTARRQVNYEQGEDGKWYASIPGFVGLYAVGASVGEARRKLAEALDRWMYGHAAQGGKTPPEGNPTLTSVILGLSTVLVCAL
jgi:predicted RNase H-like HicB family nuclease